MELLIIAIIVLFSSYYVFKTLKKQTKDSSNGCGCSGNCAGCSFASDHSKQV